MSDVPKPVTKRPILLSAGYSLPTPTRHRWIATRACTLPGPDGAAWEFVFVCETTGAERRYGVEDRRSWELLQ